MDFAQKDLEEARNNLAEKQTVQDKTASDFLLANEKLKNVIEEYKNTVAKLVASQNNLEKATEKVSKIQVELNQAKVDVQTNKEVLDNERQILDENMSQNSKLVSEVNAAKEILARYKQELDEKAHKAELCRQEFDKVNQNLVVAKQAQTSAQKTLQEKQAYLDSLLNAQTNYQVATNNLAKAQAEYQVVYDKFTLASRNYQKAQSELLNVQKLQQKIQLHSRVESYVANFENKPSKSQTNPSTSLKENTQVLPQTSGAKTNQSIVGLLIASMGLLLGLSSKRKKD